MSTIKTVFQLDVKPSFFESITVRPCGTLIVTRQDTNEIWEIDPISGAGKCIITVPEVASITGVAQVLPDVYAFGAGIYHLENHEGTVPGSYSIWVLDLRGTASDLRLVVKMPEVGLAAWDAEAVLAADSYNGRVYHVDLITGSYTVAFDDDSLKDPPNAPVRMGVNGIKVREVDGTKYVYYTNTTRMLFCRVPVDDDIKSSGPVEILATGYIPQTIAAGTMFEGRSSATIPEDVEETLTRPLPPPTTGLVPDDFCIADDGTVYMTTHPTNMVIRIPSNGGQGVKIAGGFASWDVASATACALGVTEADKYVLYVTTAGGNVVPINGQTEGAKIVGIRVGKDTVA
ncbi:hypothetical protein H9Q72_008253 [Fusarium xylarioides]|uniref:SMP-30/Gluconolactonase/LRE-like region domain-containing protein n=1 Tax=Fusarium xylarioides TaxID=221167 RepID=A0A9P7HN96_9HYPO|nr:hypothetical protein H9Q70_011010 [Fusarium xylarioides]KAG5763671.1 hypothetical protein H9Q72_008253 [Fusarium xylarioides]KAG5780216.1 hypothetical protein H9Q73_006117 [Fusarium xylarioides]